MDYFGSGTLIANIQFSAQCQTSFKECSSWGPQAYSWSHRKIHLQVIKTGICISNELTGTIRSSCALLFFWVLTTSMSAWPVSLPLPSHHDTEIISVVSSQKSNQARKHLQQFSVIAIWKQLLARIADAVLKHTQASQEIVLILTHF